VFDYLLKTASPRDVLGRVEVALERLREDRRKQGLMRALQSVVGELGGGGQPEEHQSRSAESWITVGDLEISTWNQTVRRGGQTLGLTPTEFRVLACLAQQAGQVMSFRQIIQCAQGYDADAQEAAELVKPHIYHLRQKLEPNPAVSRYILTVRGTGYMLVADPQPAP
jgi:DNA-binding response OmpR family regulator